MQMVSVDRAAQFSPFAALTGHSDAIDETARLTDKHIVLSEDKIAELDLKLQMISERINEHPEIKITFFKEDKLKEGGAYIEIKERVKWIDKYRKILVMMDGTEIEFENTMEIE